MASWKAAVPLRFNGLRFNGVEESTRFFGFLDVLFLGGKATKKNALVFFLFFFGGWGQFLGV